MNRVVSVVVVGVMCLLLLGMGVPAVLRWRAQAERARCQAHLGQVALAIAELAQRDQAFPPGTVWAKDLPPNRRLSWVVSLLPSLGLSELSKRVDSAQGWHDIQNQAAMRTPIKQLLCPALIEQATDGRMGQLHFPGIAGIGADAPELKREHPRAGVLGYDGSTPLTAVRDGTSNVFLLIESESSLGPWGAGGSTSIRAVDPADRPHVGNGRPFGGSHNGGFNAAFSDGSCRFMNEDIQSTVMELLAAMADGQENQGQEG